MDDREEFGELKQDEKFVSAVREMDRCVEDIERRIVEACEASGQYEQLSKEDKVKYDLFLSYSINSLYWMYLKVKGIDPNNHGIKNELGRIKAAMVREKQIYDRKHLRPLLDQAAAKRFVKHELWDPKQKQNKKRKMKE